MPKTGKNQASVDTISDVSTTPVVSKASNRGDRCPSPPGKMECTGAHSSLQRGLRSVSVRLCQLLKSKPERKSPCAAVADELAAEFGGAGTESVAGRHASGTPEKNIRRRIYDALNVLVSAGVIEKTEGTSGGGGATIQWRGLPSDIHVAALESEQQQLKHRIQEKRELARQLKCKQQAFQALLARNRQPEYRDSKRARISMPFVVVSAAVETAINVAKQTTEGSATETVLFEFDGEFSLNDDSELLKFLV